VKRAPEKRLDLEPDEREFLERLAASFRPAPLAPAERTAFDAALADRIDRRRARQRWIQLGRLPAAAAWPASLFCHRAGRRAMQRPGKEHTGQAEISRIHCLADDPLPRRYAGLSLPHYLIGTGTEIFFI